MNTIALVMIVKNEERCLRRCLQSAAPYVDEIIIVDTGSTDSTLAIAKSFQAQIFHFDWVNDFAAARNESLTHATADWHLILDADEYIEHWDRDGLQRFMTAGDAVGRIQRISGSMEEGEHSDTRDYMTRFIPKGLRFQGRIHEQVDTRLPRRNLPIVVQHDGYLHAGKSARNIPILLQEISASPGDPYYHYQIAREYSGIRDDLKSIESFQAAITRLSGQERYAPNVIVEYMQVLLRTKQYRLLLEILTVPPAYVHDFPDFHFASGIAFLDLMIDSPERYISYLPQVEASYRRCLELGETNRYDSVIGVGSFAALYNLGNYYEVLGQRHKALDCYQQSAQLGYAKAKARLADLNEE